MKLPQGTIILSRNIDEDVNDQFPGYYNHCSLVLSETTILESMAGDGGVVVNTIESITEHPETGEYIFLFPNNPKIANIAATYAYSLVGLPYNKLASARIFLRKNSRGENCVSLVRRAYSTAINRDVKWKIADDVWRSSLFTASEAHTNDLGQVL